MEACLRALLVANCLFQFLTRRNGLVLILIRLIRDFVELVLD